MKKNMFSNTLLNAGCVSRYFGTEKYSCEWTEESFWHTIIINNISVYIEQYYDDGQTIGIIYKDKNCIGTAQGKLIEVMKKCKECVGKATCV